MSQIYSSLPKTKGKVVLVTDCGDVEIELFSKEAPKACKNFVQLLNKLEALNFKHTIFGQVVGNTIFNVLKIAELEVDQNDRPTYPPKIIRAEVIINPFDDIVPRKKGETATSSTHKRKKQQNKNILSFSDEIDEHEVSSKKQKKELQKLEKELSEVDTLDDDTTTVPVRNTSSSSTQNVNQQLWKSHRRLTIFAQTLKFHNSKTTHQSKASFHL
ncbi:hypothetical protein C9374_000162 [Naegleria lovaniensis]|uniref:PPIase cyclophilin-type domain-containing protein n=1 Tax=Naegleria lovaniensis TaxID=51637 RepID=A0AA88GZY6_NAELO|nr:uncharacterized protein C9374_000162 [Naegleria lovaniensis]KAG2388723.1 hypothetical protein C9374_000162 [Naegleria lovaniensis]